MVHDRTPRTRNNDQNGKMACAGGPYTVTMRSEGDSSDRPSSPAWTEVDRGEALLLTDPTEAGRHAQRALDLSRDDEHGQARAAAQFLLGRSHLRRGQSQRALRLLLDALRYFRESDEERAVRTLCFIAIAHSMAENDAEAAAVLREAMERAEALGGDTLAATHNSMAMALIARQDVQDARDHVEAVIRYARTHGRDEMLSVAMNNLGIIHFDAGDTEAAQAVWEEMLALKERLGDRRGVASALLNLAKVHFAKRNLDDVAPLLERGLAIVEELSLGDHLRRALLFLSEVEEARGNLPEAIAALRRLTKLQDRQFDAVRMRSIAEMQARYDMETAEREVERSRIRSRELSDALRQADRLGSIGRLAGGIAHDFNNVLTAMTGYADLILMTVGEDDPVRPHVREIRRGGERAGQLTHQLLAFSRKQVLQPEVLDLSHAVQDLLNMLRRLLGEDIALNVELGEALHPIFVDVGQVEQIIVNLAVNARDAMPKGGVLRISTTNVDPEQVPSDVRDEIAAQAFVRLRVEDRGSGIPANVIDYIFEPFFTTKDESEGTGLGLATVYGIVKQSGGAIRVDSTEGEGTTFTIYFPRTARPAATVHASALDGELPGGTETILVVEDNGAVRELTKQILTVCGYRVLAVSDPESGLDLAAEHPGTIHLLLTDVVLPGMRGTELSTRVLDKRPETRVLYMSGYPFEALNDKGTLDPDIELVQKPFTPSELARHVRSVLDAPNPAGS